MNKTILNPIILLIILFSGCNASNDDTDGEEEVFNVRELLNDVTINTIVPTIEAFNSESKSFDALVATYVNNPTESDLNALRNQWIRTSLSYESTYNFHFGPARARFLHQAIYNWPTVEAAIEDFIANNEINEETIAPISPQIKALSGLEYLLFKADITTTNQEFINDMKRRDYLKHSSVFLVSQADRLLTIWAADGEDYASTFVNSTATGLDGSFNLFFNGLYNATDTGKVTKIGKPAGLENSPNANPEIVQAPYSNQSLELLEQSIVTTENVFFNENQVDISDYIFFVTKDDVLNNAIEAAFNDVKQDIQDIPGTLEAAVINNPSEVEALHTSLTNLNVLLGVDARSILSVVLTSTDNDGD
ncbi:MAG: imelysin family protein [Flavobacteriaceae bacterium]